MGNSGENGGGGRRGGRWRWRDSDREVEREEYRGGEEREGIGNIEIEEKIVGCLDGKK